MTTMSDDGDRTCPLCAEEMDLTDQQLKPCKCGYEICVWCWHHIMEMAEKEETEGRCPACRTPYDKDRIVKMAANCERMVAEINAEKKHKTQKAKPSKTSMEARKHLTSVRVIQRNLVYIIGLPMNICDESILERREYFGQYGKVLKVSISRPTGAAAQQASTNNTFSVYITYAREEEAIRCIQAVHNFVLEGKSLRACFGTTKYCHAWLRNMSCNNPDCLYLHDIGSQEDSFTKDEIISAYTRSRVPQMGSNASQRRVGTILPPPADDFSYSGAAATKQSFKNGTNNTSNQAKVSPPNSSAGRSTLPAASSWGLRNLSSRPTAAGVTCSQTLSKPKVDTQNNPTLISSSTKLTSAWHDDVNTASKMPEGRQVTDLNSTSKPLKLYKPVTGKESQAMTSSEASLDIDFTTIPSAWTDDEDATSVVTSKVCEKRHVVHGNGKAMCTGSSKPAVEVAQHPSKLAVSPEDDLAGNGISQSSSCLSSPVTSASEIKGINGDRLGSNTISSKSPDLKGIGNKSNAAASVKITESTKPVDVNIQNLSMEVSSVCLDSNLGVQNLSWNQHQNGISNSSAEMPSTHDSRLEQSYSKHAKLSSSLPMNKDDLSSDQSNSNKRFDWNLEMQMQGAMHPVSDMGNSLSTDRQITGHSDVVDQTSSSPYVHSVNTSNISSWNDTRNGYSLTGDNRIADSNIETKLFSSRDSASTLSNGHQEDVRSVYKPGKVYEHPGMESLEQEAQCAVKTDTVGSFDKAATVHKEESSIISDILSLEFDPWDDSLSSANNFVKMLGESEKNNAPFKLSSSWKSKSSNESRFSFARQDCQGSLLESSLRYCGHEQNFSLSSQNSHGGIYQNGLAFQSFEGPNEFLRSNQTPTIDRAAGTSRAKISAPPGFATPIRVPPPGFSSQDRSNQVYDSTYSENCLHDSLLGGNHYQPQLTRNSSDIEFIDPAILAVGKGRMPGVSDPGFDLKSMSTIPSQFSTSNRDPRIQLLMQQAISSHQNLRLSDHIGDPFMSVNDNYLASRIVAQNHGPLSPFAQMSVQQPRNSHLTNGQWEGWSDLRVGNNMGTADILRNERFGLNGLYPTNEESNFRLPGSSDLYNRAFGM